MAETTFASRCRRYRIDSFPNDVLNWMKRQLCDSHASLNRKWTRSMVYECHLDLTPIVGVNGPWSIEYDDTMVNR